MRRGSILKINSALLKEELEKRELTQVGLADLIDMHEEGI